MKGLIGALLALLVATPAHAVESLRLADAIALGMQSDPELRQAELGLDKAGVGLAGAKAERLAYGAEVGVGDRAGIFGIAGNTAPLPFNYPVANATAMAKVPLLDGGRIGQQIAQAEGTVNIQKARLDQTRQDLVWRVTSAYWQARRAELRAAIQAESVVKARGTRDVVQSNVRIGRATAAELDRAEVAFLDEENGALRADDEAGQARDQLASLLRRDLGNAQLDDPPGSYKEVLPAFEQAYELAVRHRPDVRGADGQLAVQGAGVALARAERAPQLDLVSTYQHGNNPFDPLAAARTVLPSFSGTLDARVNLTYRLFDYGVLGRNINARELDREIAGEAAASARRVAALDVRQALRRFELSGRRFTLGERSVTLATKNLAYMEGRFKFGYALLIELNEARGTLVKARNQLVDARIDMQLAKASLARSQGLLEPPTRGGNL